MDEQFSTKEYGRPTADGHWELSCGATVLPEGRVRFRIWAPRVPRMRVRVQCLPDGYDAEMQRHADGRHTVTLVDVGPGSRYYFVLDDGPARPDPVSRSQPVGVHGPSEVIDPDAFRWTDQAWGGPALKDVLLYELHVGTFTPEGTFTSIIRHLDYLKNRLGVTAIELMPVGEFPGARNWG